MEIKNLSYWDQVDRASTLASNRGTRSRRRRCIVDATKILDNEDGDYDLDQLNLDRGGGGGVEVGTGERDRQNPRPRLGEDKLCHIPSLVRAQSLVIGGHFQGE